jgi:hypothetical protein
MALNLSADQQAGIAAIVRFLLTEPGDKCGVGQLAMAGRAAGRGKSRPVAPHTGGSGRLQNKREMKSIL